MEKFIYTLIMLTGLSTTVAFAEDKLVDTNKPSQVLTYRPIAFDSLPANVQEVLALSYPCSVVNSVESITIEKIQVYRVVLSDPENMETIVCITERGEFVSPF